MASKSTIVQENTDRGASRVDDALDLNSIALVNKKLRHTFESKVESVKGIEEEDAMKIHKI